MSIQEHTLGDILRTIEGKCSRCGGKIYKSPDSQCPKCGELNNPTPGIHSNLEGVFVSQPETPTVDRMLDRFNKQWEETAMDCVRRAEELEAAAVDLRNRAERLLQARELTAEVKGAVVFEINARNRAASLVLVKDGT